MSSQIRFNIAAIFRNKSTLLSKSNTTKSKKFVLTGKETKPPQANQNGGGSSAFVISNK